MTLKKRTKGIILFTIIMTALGISKSEAYDYSVPNPDENREKQLYVVGPAISDSNSYEEQAKKNVKIDKILFPAYLRVKHVSGYIQDYPNNSGFSLKTNQMGHVYYIPNMTNLSVITQSDKGTLSPYVGTEYIDYSGDVVWNYNRAVYGNATGHGLKVGAIDGMRNFKPSQKRVNSSWVMNQWPAYPASEPSSSSNNPTAIPSGSTAEAYGSDLLFTHTLERSGSFSYKNKYRNWKTRELGNQVFDIKGEWRYLGSSSEGKHVSNPMFVPENIPTDSYVNAVSPVNGNWNILSNEYRSQYNKSSASGDVAIVRDRTMNVFMNALFPKKNGIALNRSECIEYFNISVPYGANVSAVLEATMLGTGKKDVTLISDGVIDIEVSKMAIMNDKGVEIYATRQDSTNNGIIIDDWENTNAPADGSRGIIVNDDVWIRSEANWSATRLKVVTEGSEVKIISVGSNWSKIEHQGTTGYVNNDYIQIPGAKRGVIIDNSSAIRREASWSSSVVKNLSKGNHMRILADGAAWAKVEYQGTTGYVPRDHIADCKLGTVNVSSTLNIRSQPDANSTRVAQVSNGTQLSILRESGNTWYEVVLENGIRGHASKTYITSSTFSMPRRVDSRNASSKVKLQPGKTYTLRVDLKNRASGHIIYNPAVNVLLDSKPNVSNDYISDPSSADAYGVYTCGNYVGDYGPGVKKSLSGAVTKDSQKGYFDLDGTRLLYNGSQKKVPPYHVNNTLDQKGSGGITLKFTIDGAANESEMRSRFGVTDPNAVQMKMATQLNDKHSISDNVFYRGGIANVDTSIDNLMFNNDSIGMRDWSAAQDLSISGANDYTLKDASGQSVTEMKKGDDYKLRIKVYNGSKIWDTSMAPKINYTIKNADTGEVIISQRSVQGNGIIYKSSSSTVSSKEVEIPINIPRTVRGNNVRIEAEISPEHNENYDDWYSANNKFALNVRVIDPVDLTIKESMGDIVGDNLPSEILVFSGERVNLLAEIASNADFTVGPVKVKWNKTPDNEEVVKTVASLDKNNTQEVNYIFTAPTVGPNEPDKIYTVTAEINPEGTGRIDEMNYNNNKTTFRVRVTGDISRFGCTSIINQNLSSNGRPNGLAAGQIATTADTRYTSYVPTVTVRRRDKVNGSFGSWYDYPIQLRAAQLRVPTREEHKIKEVLFKSKFTTDRYAENLDRDKINSEGFIDILAYPNYAKVKAGYGYEIKVKTIYKTDIREAYEDYAEHGMNAILSTGRSVYDEVRSIVDILNRNADIEINTTQSTMRVSFGPDPRDVALNRRDEVLCVMMPNGDNVYSSIDTSRKLVERIPRVPSDANDPYRFWIGVEFNYQFTNRSDGMGDESRKYYINENTKNTTNTNKYYMRLATNRIGIGGLTHAVNNGPYDVKDIEIIVYGGRYDDLKDTGN